MWYKNDVSQPSGKKIYIPPYSGVRLIECRDHFQLVPVPEVRHMFGYGKMKASEVRVDPDDPNSEQFWDNCGPDEEVWVVMEWYEFEDGTQEPGNICHMRGEDVTEEKVKREMERMAEFCTMTREELLQMTHCFRATEDDYQYIDDRCPNYQTEPDPNATDEYDVYHARLKVMSELQPKTVALIKIANATKDPVKRKFVEHEAVQSFFAELAHYFTEDEVLAWVRNNPVGTGWMCEFGEVMREPRRTISPVNHELALNWLREKYNLLTEAELSLSIFKRILIWLTPGAIKKRRERLGLTSKRKTGPPPKSDCQ
jgi:hypothetical protein